MQRHAILPIRRQPLDPGTTAPVLSRQSRFSPFILHPSAFCLSPPLTLPSPRRERGGSHHRCRDQGLVSAATGRFPLFASCLPIERALGDWGRSARPRRVLRFADAGGLSQSGPALLISVVAPCRSPALPRGFSDKRPPWGTDGTCMGPSFVAVCCDGLPGAARRLRAGSKRRVLSPGSHSHPARPLAAGAGATTAERTPQIRGLHTDRETTPSPTRTSASRSKAAAAARATTTIDRR